MCSPARFPRCRPGGRPERTWRADPLEAPNVKLQARAGFGGADLPFKNAAARDVLLPRQARRLQGQYEELFGVELAPVAYAWAGSFAETRVPGMNPRLQFALCYGGNGITYSVHAGDILRAGIEGRVHDLDDVFGFGRLGAVSATTGGQARGQWT